MTLEMDALIAAETEDATRSERVRAAWRTFLATLPKPTRLSLATEPYRRNEASISRAAEIADVPLYEMRRMVIAEGLEVAAPNTVGFGQDAKRLAARRGKSNRRILPWTPPGNRGHPNQICGWNNWFFPFATRPFGPQTLTRPFGAPTRMLPAGVPNT